MLPNRPRSSRSKQLCICMEESVFPGKRSILNDESISGRIIIRVHFGIEIVDPNMNS